MENQELEKTLLAKALSRECGCNFIPISGPELMSGIVGDSEKRIRDLFERAKREGSNGYLH